MNVRNVLAIGGLAAALVVSTGVAAWADGSPTMCGFKGGDPVHGDVIFHQTCAACHGDDGRGKVPGTPDFTAKGGVLSLPHADLTDHIQNGFSEPGKPLAMPARGGNPNLTDQDIKDVHAYLHKAFGCGK